MPAAKKPAKKKSKQDVELLAELSHSSLKVAIGESTPEKEADRIARKLIPADPGISVHIRGVEGIPGSLDLVFLDGMNLLTGHNEDGKTSATLATVVAAGGDIGRPLRANDTVESGTVRGMGTVLNVGGRTTRTGSPSVELADYGTLGELIEPAGKTAATRDKRRVDILMDYVSTPVTPELLLEMAGGDEEVAGGVQGKKGEALTLRAAASAVKRMAEAVARDYESRAKASGELERTSLQELAKLKGDIAGYPRPKGSAAEASGRLETAIRAHQEVVHAREVRLAREEEREAWGDLGEKPDVEALRAEWQKISEDIGALEERLDALRRRQADIKREGERLAIDLKTWEERSAALARPVEGPELEEVDAAERAVTEARADLEVAQLYERVDALSEAVSKHRADAKAAEREASRRRDVARGVGGVINRLIAKEDLGGLALDLSDAHDPDEEEGKGEERWRLCRVDPATGQLEPFERLSLGARARLVLTGIGCRRYPGRVMPIEPGIWYALQPARQRELVTVAIGEGIKLISEVPTDIGGVRVVHLGEEWVASGVTAEAWVLSRIGGAK